MRTRTRAWLLLLTLGASVPLAAQPTGLPVFRSSIELTTVTTTVQTASGQLVEGLPREAFALFEDGVAQRITHFSNERVPVSLAVLLDTSDSMFGQRLQDARLAIGQFVIGLIERGDEFAIVAFNHKQEVLAQWTSDGARAEEVMAPIRPFGSTAIYDALLASLPLAATRNRPRAALLVVSDGADTASDASLRDVRTQLLRTDAFVYAVAIDPASRRPINAPVNVGALSEITDQSGGRTRLVHNTGEIGTALTDIANELNRQYLIGYSSSHGNDGKYHSIRVRVPDTDYRVRARNGYMAERR
jgi:Ca-activated chloride channel homolog